MKKKLIIFICLLFNFWSCKSPMEIEFSNLCNNVNSLTPIMINDTLIITSLEYDFPGIFHIKYKYSKSAIEHKDSLNTFFSYKSSNRSLIIEKIENDINNNQAFSSFKKAGYDFSLTLISPFSGSSQSIFDNKNSIHDGKIIGSFKKGYLKQNSLEEIEKKNIDKWLKKSYNKKYFDSIAEILKNTKPKYLPTERPVNGFSPYDSFFSNGLYDNSSLNTIEVTAPLQVDIVIFIKDINTNKIVRNEYIRADSVFSLTGVPYGSYKFIYIYGNEWSANAPFKGAEGLGNFLKDKGVSKSDKSIDFEFKDGYIGNYTLKLQLLLNGNLTTVTSSEDEI